ncbi:MAG: hypothetical protein LBC96_07885 [Lachnospiraceae bacterium]|jgi:uncharacterized protein YukE|nr:hypothetical protein [Lachnospiraceae bacterium]
MNNEIRFSQALMTDIKINYDNAALEVENIIYELKKTYNNYEWNYRGMAKYALSEGLPKTIDHLEFLRDCLVNASAYVQHSWETMNDTDQGLAKAIK